jgi:DNA repair exonuclease SbcCD ATPase subunit
MRLHLENFLCYERESFDFGETGFALISGPSGSGKTSLVRAILFVLFGTGTKLVKYGKTACKVVLEWQDMHIQRTKRPNRLVVNHKEEDAAAQELIIRRFGKHFGVSGYIPQSTISSFILKSPMEKLEILEQFACGELDMVALKKRIKTTLTQRKESLIRASGALDAFNSLLSTLDRPKPPVFPFKCPKHQRDRYIKNVHIRQKNAEIRLSKAQKQRLAIRQEGEQVLVLESKVEDNNFRLHEIHEQTQKISQQLLHINFDPEHLLELERKFQELERQEQLSRLKERYKIEYERATDLEQEELNALNTTIKSIQTELYNEYAKTELPELISDTQGMLKDFSKVEVLRGTLSDLCTTSEEQVREAQTRLAELQKQVELAQLSQDTHPCPKCHTLLSIDASGLHESNQQPMSKQKLKDLTDTLHSQKEITQRLSYALKKRNETENTISSILKAHEEMLSVSELQQDLDYLLSYSKEQTKLEKKLKLYQTRLDSKELSKTCTNLLTEVQTLHTQIQDLEQDSEDNVSVSETKADLTTILQKERKKEKDYLVSSRELESLQREQEKVETMLNKQVTELNGRTSTAIESKIQDLLTIEEEQTLCLKEQAEQLAQIAHWQQQVKQVEEYNAHLRKRKELRLEETALRHAYEGTLLLKEKILEAESRVLSSTIANINAYAQYYLEQFFQENSIQVLLKSFKETKQGGTKASIHVSVLYKEMECELSTLSGGELARVVLAFTLALAEMFRTPLLLLDECTANLDQELTATVFDGIRERFAHEQLVLVIAHQVVKGTFDRVIPVDTCE